MHGVGAFSLGSWIVLIGASQASVWTQQLVNLLAPGALDSLRDDFVSDGSMAAVCCSSYLSCGWVLNKTVALVKLELASSMCSVRSNHVDALTFPFTKRSLFAPS